MKTLLLMLVIFCSYSCNELNIKYPSYQIKEITINQIFSDKINDSTYCGYVNGIIYYEGNLIVSDYQNGQIYILNTKLNLVGKISRKGKGPGEIIQAGDLFVKDDTVYISDAGKQSIILFDLNGTFIDEILLPDPLDAQFEVENGILYYSDRLNHPNNAFNLKNHTNVLEFGTIHPHTLNYKESAKATCHTFLHFSQVVCVAQHFPIIYRYDFNGDAIDSCDLSSLPILADHIKAINEKVSNNPVSHWDYYFFNSAYILKDHLYAMCRLSKPGNTDRKVTSILLKLNLGDSIILNTIYQFNNEISGHYKSFCVYENEGSIIMATFDNHLKEFHSYKLD